MKITKNLTRFILLFVVTLTLVLCATVTASAADIVKSGTCGSEAKWELDSDGVLTISGIGPMKDYTYSTSSSTVDYPWRNYKSSIKSVVVADRVLAIGNNAFRDCDNLSSVTIKSTVNSIDANQE